uniref:U26-Sparatoxin-Hju1a_1 n=1 Tax=Heteropoda jugulans TaxID=1358901 RepID=A0A4Q8KAK7_9ARAC
MKFTVLITLLVVVFSAVVLAEDSIEQAAMDIVVARSDDCGGQWGMCEEHEDCCANFMCYLGTCVQR